MAALCKVDCFDLEPDLTQAIIQRAQQEITQQTASVVTLVFALIILNELKTLGEKLELQSKHQAVLARSSETNQYVYNVLLATARSLADARRIFAESTRHFPLLLSDSTVQRSYVISYNTLINKSTDFTTAQAFFEEMKSLGLKPNIVTYNTLLRKIQTAPFRETLRLLEAMQAAGLQPQSKLDKRTRKMRHYTVEAVRPSVRKNRQAFEEWVKTKGSQHPVWQRFYEELSEP